MSSQATIWCNMPLSESARARLVAEVGTDRLRFSKDKLKTNLPAGVPDGSLDDSDAVIAFGQPHGPQCAQQARLRWVHLSSAGYGPFEAPAVRAPIAARGTLVSTSSTVYAEPCAQHVLAFLLMHARRLPVALADQAGPRAWPKAELRRGAVLLRGQTVLLVGMGSIARRLCELLAPFGLDLMGVRRRPQGDEPIPTIAVEAIDEPLSRADVVIDLLPGNGESARFFDADRFARMKPGALFINIGRGTTVEQTALASALTGGVLGGAYLDVTDPEPLPGDHPLWSAPHCVITPHMAGGHSDEQERLVLHFAANLRRFDRGEALLDRVI